MEEIFFIVFVVASLVAVFLILFFHKSIEKTKEKGGSFIGIFLELRKEKPIVGWVLIAIFSFLACLAIVLNLLRYL